MKNPIKTLSCLFRRKPIIEHEVVFSGKKMKISSKGTPNTPPQKFIDENAVACGLCGDMMLPGSKLWLYTPEDKKDFNKPAVLSVGEGEDRSLVACLGWECCPTAGLVCGELGEARKITLFESPMQKAIRSNVPVIIEDIGTYKG